MNQKNPKKRRGDTDPQPPRLSPDLLHGVQANILKGHGRNHTVYVFFNIVEVDAARTWLHKLPITSMFEQLEDTCLFKLGLSKGDSVVQVLALSAAGLRKLGHDAAQPSAFADGMAARAATLNDPAPQLWDFASPDGVLLLAQQTEDGVAKAARDALQDIAGISVLRIERGAALKNANGDGIEHFGYVDGRSQPLFFPDEIAQEEATGGIDQWHPGANLDQVLLADPLASAHANAYGSYFVFRKLEQNVAAFKAREAELAQQLGLFGEDAERAGALVVGRFEDGTPLAVYEQPIGASKVLNNFNFTTGNNGQRCPLHAHIRLTNPRTAGAAEPESAFLMARRGITYGARDQDPISKALKDQPTAGVGLLFQAYMANIETQFEETQVRMANQALDPVIGQGITAQQSQQWTNQWNGSSPFRFADFVLMRGGEYFYAPSIPGIKAL
jgi:Dyp-type peroxidase family